MEITKAKFMEAVSHTEENHDDIRLREGYSGRGMYGETCYGVVGDETALAEFETALALLTVMDDLDDEVNGYTALNALTDVQDMRREDSMGLDRIYYYPSLTVTE
jgi:hypothetical protein